MFKVIEVLTPVLVGMITVFGGALINLYVENKKLKNKNTTLQSLNDDFSLGLQIDLQIFNEIKDLVTDLFQATKADRFLILSAINGTSEFRFATAIYEQHKSGDITISIGATNRYVKFEFDTHYRRMLKDIEYNGSLIFDVDSMPECDLKRVYESEQIKHSKVFKLRRVKINEKDDRFFYGSVATHSSEKFSELELLKIRLSVDKLGKKIGEMKM